MEKERLSFIGHLEELRRRIVICLLTIGIGFIISYIFSDELFSFICGPYKEAKGVKENIETSGGDTVFVFITLPEAFLTYLKLSLYSGIFFSVPIILYETWAFIAPGLYSREKRYVLPLVVSSFFLFQLGAIFAFYVIFPLAFRFFLGFSGEFIRPLLSIKEYLAFVTRFLLISGIIFQTPILIFMLAKFGIVNVQFLVAHRKYALLAVVICAAILTPPDFFSQILLAIPLIVLYEVGIIITRLFGKKEESREG